MKKVTASLFALILLRFAAGSVVAQNTARTEQSNIVKVNLSQAEIDRIIQSFAKKEFEFRQALGNYSFKREATMQSLGFGGQVSGEYRRDSQYVFNQDGSRIEKVLFAPTPTFNAVTAEDLQDLGGVNQFALEPSKINLYNLTFVGKEKIDELNLYVFDVTPKVIPDPKKSKERLFTGRIWVDDQDLQIVKTKGKGVPETKDNKFPIVGTFRENVDGKYWFPTYAYANDQLFFEKAGSTLHVKMKVKYTDYKEATTSVRVLEGDEEIIDESKQQQPSTPPQTAPKKP